MKKGISHKWSYQRLYEEVCKFSNVLKNNGVKKGDRVCIYMPMVLEAVVVQQTKELGATKKFL